MRTTDSSTSSGIPNVPIVLQNTATNYMLAVTTDINGNYSFNNIPDGSYRIVEAYGTPASTPPGDFSKAVFKNPAIAVFPPISFVNNLPNGATDLDAITPSTLLVTVSGEDLTEQNIINGPVRYTPIHTILDSNVTVLPENLITKADNGTFGNFPQGTPANIGANPIPYPDIGTQFNYALPNPVGVTPAFHQYTIQNIMNDATANVQQTWWRASDHTTGNETGRMMVINGDVPGSAIFQQQVTIKSNTYYLLSSWILNLSKSADLVDPQLGVEVLDANDQVLYSATLGTLIPMNPNEPEWKQIGTIINSKDNSSLTVRFISMGAEAFGNDYAIDDISLNEVEVNAFIPKKTADPMDTNPGATVTYTVTLANTGANPLTDVVLRDMIPPGFLFVPGSVIVNGTSRSDVDPNVGFSVSDILGGGTLTVTFKTYVTEVPSINPAVNNALVYYSYTPVAGGIPDRFTTKSNDAPVNVNWLPECCWPFLPFRPLPR
jgi:uncharacterized repeat protein (TIGR01451 family)